MNTTSVSNEHNLMLLTDSYKISHYRQYPPKTMNVHSYFESRGGRWPHVTFFGPQYIIKKYLTGQQVTLDKIQEAKDFCLAHFGMDVFNERGWKHIFSEHGGYLPISIRTVPEGTTVPVSNVLMTVENTDPKCYWLTNFLETLLVQTWYPSTVCTNSRMTRQLILQYLEETGDPSLIDYKLHDFGFRGSTSVESAGIGGAAHLVNFNGTDTLEAILTAKKYYGESMAGHSINAAEHSTITSWGKENEAIAYANMLKQYPEGFVAVVSDSYDVFNACRNIWGGTLRKQVLERNGVLVIRPDSGNPPDVVVQVLDILGQVFSATKNKKGYRVLHPKVRVIQGDGIDHDMVGSVLGAVKDAEWSADNIAFGSGGGLLQKVNRDSQRFAFKCSAVCIDDQWHDVYKDPVTDHEKKSKAGRLALIRDADGSFKTVRVDSTFLENQLIEVYRNGELMVDEIFDDIRQRARS